MIEQYEQLQVDGTFIQDVYGNKMEAGNHMWYIVITSQYGTRDDGYHNHSDNRYFVKDAYKRVYAFKYQSDLTNYLRTGKIREPELEF